MSPAATRAAAQPPIAPPPTPAPVPTPPQPAPVTQTTATTRVRKTTKVAPKIITPVIVLSALLAGSMTSARAADVNVFPGAVAPGASINASLTATGISLDGLVGCKVDIPAVGCHVVGGTVKVDSAMITITAASFAMGTVDEPMLGNLRLTFSNGTTLTFVQKIVKGQRTRLEPR